MISLDFLFKVMIFSNFGFKVDLISLDFPLKSYNLCLIQLKSGFEVTISCLK